MSMLHPLIALAGVGLIALPIILHLIMRQRPKRFEFPALRFVQKRHDANRRKLRLRHLLLLLLRAAAILFLALALSRPTVHFGGSVGTQEAPVAAAIIFDTAPRMEYRHGNETRIEAAREFGKWLLAQLPSKSEIAVLDTRPGPGSFPIDHGLAQQRIDRLRTVANSQPLPSVIAEALRLLEKSELPNKEIYVLSDLSRGAWPSGTGATMLRDRLEKIAGARVHVIDVGIEKPRNCALGELRLSGEILTDRSPLVIDTEVSCVGRGGGRTVELHMLDRQQPRKPGEPPPTQLRAAENITVEPGKSQPVRLSVDVLDIGTHQGFVRIVGQDGLACDDRRFFTVEVRPAPRVLIATPKPTGRYSLFLTESLAPSDLRKRGEAWFDCDVVALDELAEQSLDEYAAVCLLDPTPLDEDTWNTLGDYVSSGHGLAVFLGRNANVNVSVDSFNTEAAQKLLPGKLLWEVPRRKGDVFLAPQNYDHPVLAEFRDIADVTPWDASPVFRYWQLDEPAGMILPYRDGQPALLERIVGEGRVLTMTTPISDSPNRQPWNLLPVGNSWPSMVLVIQMIWHLAGSEQQQLNYVAGETVRLQLPADSSVRSLMLFRWGMDRDTTSKDGDTDRMSMKVPVDLKTRQLQFTSTDKADNYGAAAGGSTGINRGFSVNLTPRQTELQRITPQQLTELFGDSEVRLAKTRDDIESGIRRGRVGRELFPMFILAVGLVLAMEHVVSNRFYRE